MRVAVSGGFDPIHIGHIKLFREARRYGFLYVILNSDRFLMKKKGFVFMPFEERYEIISSIKYVGSVVECIDNDMTVCKTIEVIKPDIFCNGGDRLAYNTPEYEICKRLGIKMIFGVGGEKIQSSSELAKRIKLNEGIF